MYLTAGPRDGQLLFFLHGWPGLGVTWKPQLEHFGELGYYALAPDMPGYGGTWTSEDASDFALEKIISQLIELLHHTGRQEAIWIGHDWGTGPLYALAAHYPEACRKMVGISVPYRTLELGLPALLPTIDRTLYPQAEYPNGQWDYQVFYEENQAAADRQFETMDPVDLFKICYARGHADTANTVAALTARVTRDKGWFGGPDMSPPKVPLSMTVLDDDLLAQLVASANQHGWHGATSWYLNHAANREYGLGKSVNDGILNMPVLFIHTEYDMVCQTLHNAKLIQEMREFCKNLSEVVVKAGHWAALECPGEVNASIGKFIGEEIR